jgi:hypothetical protein
MQGMSTQSTEPTPVKHDLVVEATVRVTVKDPDVIERVTGPKGDEWRELLYQLHTEADVLEHFAYNAVANGVGRCNVLDGWADLPDDAATFDVVDFAPQP